MTTAAAALASLDERLGAFYAGDPELTTDPFPLYHELRERDPVHPFGEGSVLVTSHPLAKSVYRQPELFVTHRGRGRFADSVRLLSEHELDLLDEVNAFERM